MHRYFREYGHSCGGRHARRHGFGGLFGVVGGRGFGWHGFRSGRKLGGDDLQLVVLALLADKPYHGYEIMKALEERSGGFYSPSPGMVYPALTYLEEIGYASVEAEGAKKLYRITAEGRAHLDQNRSVVDAIFAQLAWVSDKMEHVRRAFAGEEKAPGKGAGAQRGFSAELDAARRALRSELAALADAPADEQRRVAQILERAAAQIRDK